MNGQRQKRKPNWMQKKKRSGRKILQKVCSFRYHSFPQQNRRKELHQHEQIGSLHRNYLKDYKSGLYSYLTLSGKLWTYLADLNEQCLERRDFLMEQIMEQEGITEELKSRDQMEWVRRANNARSRVDEIILNELVYV